MKVLSTCLDGRRYCHRLLSRCSRRVRCRRFVRLAGRSAESVLIREFAGFRGRRDFFTVHACHPDRWTLWYVLAGREVFYGLHDHRTAEMEVYGPV